VISFFFSSCFIHICAKYHLSLSLSLSHTHTIFIFNKCTWKADEISTSVYPRFPLAAYILNNPDKHSYIPREELVDILAVGSFYGSERLPKWFHAKCRIPSLLHAARPNFFTPPSNNKKGKKKNNNNSVQHDSNRSHNDQGDMSHDDDYLVNGGGISFTWYCRAMFRRQLHPLLQSSLKASSVPSYLSSLSSNTTTTSRVGSNEEDEDEVNEAEVDAMFDLLVLVQSAHNAVYGSSTPHNKKYGLTDPIWLRHIKAQKLFLSSSDYLGHHKRMWSKWGSHIAIPSLNEINQCDGSQLDKWLEFETVSALYASNGALLSCYEKGDLKGVCKVWGFDSDSITSHHSNEYDENDEESSVNSHHKISEDDDDDDEDENEEAINSELHNNLTSYPTLIYPGWNGSSNVMKGFKDIKEYYESNFIARQTNVQVFVDQVEVHIDSSDKLSGLSTLTVRVEVPKNNNDNSHQASTSSSSSSASNQQSDPLVRCLLISNSYKRSAIGEPFVLVHHHISVTA
jgi:hypothetical protein